jgi:hypothetical protein
MPCAQLVNLISWSFGVLMWEMWSIGVQPYFWVQQENLLDFLTNGKRMPKPAHADDEMYVVKCAHKITVAVLPR